MKRLIPLLLALMLCGCAGGENPEASEQTTIPRTQPVGLHIVDHEIETATSGAVLAFDITGAGVYAVEDGVGILNAEGKLTIIDRDEGLIQNTLSHISQVITAEGRYIYYYDGAIIRLDLVKEKRDSFALPETVQGDVALCARSQKIFYCVPGQVRALDMETGLDRLLKEHSAQEQTILGAYYDGAVIEWKTENGTAYLSATDGSELSREQGIETLYTHGQQYLLMRTDGMVEQVIAGQRGGEAKLVNLPKEGLIPALSVNGLVQQEEMTFSFYDLTTGMKTAVASLSDTEKLVSVAADDRYIWLLTETALYRWEPAKSNVTDETVYTGPLYTPENPDPAGMEACQNRVSQINKDYGIRIRIGAEAVSQPGEYVLVEEHQPEAIGQMLDQLELLLQKFPKGFLRKTVEKGWVRVCLVRQINNGQPYARYWVDGDCYVAIGLEADMQEAFLIGLGGAVDSHILGNSRDLEYWEDMNPKGFAYSYGDPVPEKHLQYVGAYFADEASMTFPSEDRARIFYYAITEGNEERFAKDGMQNKLKTLCEGIREAYGLKKNPDILPWEQYLQESLAYVK